MLSKLALTLHYLRLGGFPLGLGLISVLVGGTLNRVMIVEYGLPVSLVGFFFAVPLLISPVRVWLGYWSDGYPIRGRRREPYILFGALLSGVGVLAIADLAAIDQSLGTVALVLTLLAFIAYGFGKDLASNTFEALLADKFEGEARPRAVTAFKIALFIGIISGAIGLGQLLDPFSSERLSEIVLGVVLLLIGMTVIGTVWQEPRTERIQAATHHARQTAFWYTIRTIVWADPQVRLFFIVLILTVVGTQAQDVILEPYGALVLNMSVSETTRLTALWGSGTLIAMTFAGMWLIKRMGYLRVLKIGLWCNAFVFAGIIAVGFSLQVTVFKGLVFLLGVGTGLSAAGMLTGVIEFTTAIRAGLLMGVWGMAHELGQGLGSLFGGIVVDLIRQVTSGNNLLAYSTVFALEAVLLVIAIFMLRNVRIAESRAVAEARSAHLHPADTLEANMLSVRQKAQ